MSDKQPVFILPENIQRMIGRDAQRNNILAAKLVADTIKTTLGPKGMDKMLVNSMGDITITNDGVTILEEMEVEHPAAKMLVEVAKTQENTIGDGTTTSVIIAGKLLENSEKLLDKRIHPVMIAKGYRIAEERCRDILDKISSRIDIKDDNLLKNIAKTAMTGKGAEIAKEKFAEIIVKAVKQIMDDKGKIDMGNIKIEKNIGDGVEDTELIEGIIIDKEKASSDMPSMIQNAKIALLDIPLEIKGPETDTKISVTSPEQLQLFIDMEEKTIKDMVKKIKESKANVIFCQKGIDDIAQYYFSRENILAVRRVAQGDMEKLSKATGARIIGNLNELNEKHLGYSKLVEEIKNRNSKMIYVRDCKNPKALTILIRGGTGHVVDEIERAIKDGLGDVASALESGKIVAGGGAIEVETARLLRKIPLKGREMLAVEQFADALESIPIILAENAGLDPIDILTELKARHQRGENKAGLNLFNGKIEDTLKQGIIEPLNLKIQAIKSASEVAIMLLRIDDVIASGKQPQQNMPNMNGMY